jgi:hypothetical protein
MRTKILFQIILFLIYPTLVFSIEVGGHVTEDTVWLPENNPYHIIHDVYVDEGVTLTIAPGTIIKLDASECADANWQAFMWQNGEAEAKMIWVNGKIIAEGTEQDTIIFTRYPDIPHYRWGTIYFPEGNENMSVFKHCKIEFSHLVIIMIGFPLEGGLCVHNGKIYVENCLIKNNRYGIEFREKGIESVLIKNNVFKLYTEIPVDFWEYPIAPIDFWISEPSQFPALISSNHISGGIECDDTPIHVVDNTFIDGYISVLQGAAIPSYIYRNGFNGFGVGISEYDQDTVYIRKNELVDANIYAQGSFVDIAYNYLNSSYIDTEGNSIGNVYNNIVRNSNNIGIKGGSATVFNNIVKDCATGCGFWASREKVVKNNIFISNEYAFNHLLGNQIIENNIIIDNTHIFNNDDIYESPLFRNNILDFPIPEHCIDGCGNIWEAPMFVDGENGDYHLLPESPCIDAGFDTLVSYYPLFDLDHNFRIWDGNGNDTARIDIGVYEYGSQYVGGIEGTVYEYGTGNPVDYVLLKINNENSIFEFTDSVGFYHFDLQPGIYDLYASRVFYDDVIIEDIEVVASEITPITFTMVCEESTLIKDKKINITPAKLIIYNYPNPFNAETNINYQLLANSNVQLTIYDITGKLVKILVNEQKQAGYYTITWNGKDENWQNVPSGVYFYHIKTDNGFEETKSMLLLK